MLYVFCLTANLQKTQDNINPIIFTHISLAVKARTVWSSWLATKQKSSARRALGSSSPLRLIFSRRRLPIPAAVRLNQARNSVHQVHQHPILHRSQQKAVISGARSGSNAPLGDLGRQRLMQMHRPPKTTHKTAQNSTKQHPKKHKTTPQKAQKNPRNRTIAGIRYKAAGAYFESA